jgi:Tat protein secretion system quality control protein TatD with DNase activity
VFQTAVTWNKPEKKHWGVLFGLGGVITFKNSGLKKLSRFALDKIVLETDAPYLAQCVPWKNESGICYMLEKLGNWVFPWNS